MQALSRQSLSQANPTGGGRVYRGLATVVSALARVGIREDWDAADALPASGPCLIVANHVSYADPVIIGRYLIWHGRWPRLLGKSELWKAPVIGWLARECEQIPVYRNSERASDALAAAKDALDRGECVVIYPEGTRTRDPEYWPMTARTGAARLALATGVPVIPMASWGAHEVMPGRKLMIPRIWPPKRVQVRMGQPLDLSDLTGGAEDREAVREASARIMAAITGLVEDMRGEKAPEGVWDTREGRRVTD